MNQEPRINDHFKDSIETKQRAQNGLIEPIKIAGNLMVNTLLNEGKILTCGNGGSAADAQHFSAELLNRFEKERPGLPAIALTTDSSTLTAIANDYGYDAVFSRQVAGLAQAGDVLLAISTSGNSVSVLNACEQARSMGCEVIGLTGRDGGALKAHCRALVIAASQDTAHIQEAHIVVIHLLCALIEEQLDWAALQ